MAEYYYSDTLSEAKRNQDKIPLMEDADRKKVQFLVINASGSAENSIGALIARAQVNGQKIPVIQDKNMKLIKSVSNNDPAHKDDMALFDKEGRLIKYFESNVSWMGGKPNVITKAVTAALAGDYDGKCDGGEEPKEETPKESKCEPVNYKYKGKKQKGGKAKTACDCHQICADKGLAGFIMKVPKKKFGKCTCLETVKKGKRMKTTKKWISGEI